MACFRLGRQGRTGNVCSRTMPARRSPPLPARTEPLWSASMGHSWERTEGRRVHYAHVTAREVVVGSHTGSGHTDHAGACSYAEFLAGRFHDAVRSGLGADVLAELIEAVRGAADDPSFRAERAVRDAIHAMLAAIPQDPTLPALLSAPGLVYGSWALHRGARGLSLACPEGTLSFDALTAIARPNQGQPCRVALPGYPSGTLFAGGCWLLATGGALLLDPSGRVRTPASIVAPPWGSALRGIDVYALQTRLFFTYRWFHEEDGPPGVCELRPDEGFVGHSPLPGMPPFVRPPNGYGAESR